MPNTNSSIKDQFFTIAIAAGTILFWSGCTSAAELPTVIDSSELQTHRSHEDTFKQSERIDELPDDSAPSVIEDLKVDDSAKPQTESDVENEVTFLMQGVKVVGNKVLKDEDIIPIFKPHVGKQITGSELKGLAAQITNMFSERGYSTSRCTIPAQKVEDGVVVFQIEENKLGKVLLAGKSSYRYEPRLFNQHFHDLKGKIIHTETLGQRVRLLSKLPATRIQPILHKSAFGVSNLILSISDLEDTHTLSVNNKSSRLTGTYLASFSSSFYNLTGHGDWLKATLYSNPTYTKRYGAFNLDYTFPFGKRGGNITTKFLYLNYQLDNEEMNNSEVIYEGGSSSFSLMYEEPFLLDAGDFWWTAGFEMKHATSDSIARHYFSDTLPAGSKLAATEDNLLVGVLGVRGTLTDQLFYDNLGRSQNRNLFEFQVKHAFEGLFNSMTEEDILFKIENNEYPDSLSFRPAGPIGDAEGLDPDFWKFYLSLSRLQSLPYMMIARFVLSAEYSPSRKRKK